MCHSGAALNVNNHTFFFVLANLFTLLFPYFVLLKFSFSDLEHAQSLAYLVEKKGAVVEGTQQKPV